MVSHLAVVENGTVVESYDADVMVPWWSVTKTVIAAAALVLVQQKTLSLDEPLAGQPYTLRRLLQHRAGIANYDGLASYHEAVAAGEDPWPVPVLLERTDAARLRYEPGQGWAYSNIGYLLVRQLIEQTCGDFGDALARLVLGPLEIDDARLARSRVDLDGVITVPASYHPGWVYHGLIIGPLKSAGVFMDRVLGGRLLAPALLEEMCRAQPVGGPVAGRPWQVPAYGLGLMAGVATDGQRAIGHTGGGPGSIIAVYQRPEAPTRFTAATFVSGDDPGRAESAAFMRRRP